MTRPPVLLTPGPLTTSDETKRAMLVDWGSWDSDFRALTAEVRRHLLAIAGGTPEHAVVLMQGSGTFAVEAAIGTLVPQDGKLLVLVNGSYGRRMAKLTRQMGCALALLEVAEDQPITGRAVSQALATDAEITHVGVIHCETSTGILNPLTEIAAAVQAAGRALIVDAMSSFGALPLDISALPAVAVIASANKCLEGVPGLGFVVTETAALTAAAGNSPSLSLDLTDQWRYMEETGQFRFTPPTHVVAALAQALRDYADEGGRVARQRRYQRNCAVLVDGMAGLGFVPLLPAALQAPIIVTFHAPRDPAYRFDALYQALKRRGFIIYPGKTTEVESFRIGCIGHFDETVMREVVEAVAGAISELGLHDLGPAVAS
ncbi:MAG: 2-aminoethylphosphonate--pyruvate transaminase [Azospirillaceae bacterium]|nr:2-aminoethylphosphonate--pyruvate transaminase [Azospirillaceae bacterium]